MTRPLSGRTALVAGATRGAGRAIAVELARAAVFVYATGGSSRAHGPSEMGRPETIEETEELMTAAGGSGRAMRVDHLEPAGGEADGGPSAPGTAASTSWSTTSSAATATRRRASRCGSTTSRAGCVCSGWGWTRT